MSDEQLRPATPEELTEAIDYALRFKVHMPMIGSRKAVWSGCDSRIAAKQIADYLELCGFRPRRTPPLEGHGHAFPGSRKAE